MLRRLRTASGQGRDTGAVTILFAVGITAIMMIIAVSVDVSASLRASYRARALAEQAARAGAEQISIEQALAGDGGQISDEDGAVQAAACGPGALPGDAQCVGPATVSSDDSTVQVTIAVTYSSWLHTMFGTKVDPQTGTATALLVTVTPPSP